MLPPDTKSVQHRFLHPFTKEPLFDGGTIQCLNLKELVAEKFRAAATRLTIAPRDFYDLGYILRSGFNFGDNELRALIKTKLAEDGFDTDLRKYRNNLGRHSAELKDMESRIESELLDVLTLEEGKRFSLSQTLRDINNAIQNFE